MIKQAQYNIRTPKALVGEFFNNDFYIGMGPSAVKVAQWWDAASLSEKYHLLKTAEASGSDDLATAYDEALATMPREDSEESE